MTEFKTDKFEKKWQKEWDDAAIYKVSLEGVGSKYYLLVELPYPSGDLHMGHWFTFAVSDVLARYMRMKGKKVFMPIGFDAFGLPAENAAIKRGIHPEKWTYANIEKMKKQFASMGTVGDFEHGVITCDPAYFRWNQWIFLKMLSAGLACKGKAFSNWCPGCATVLANENVEAGRCWRCQTEVVQKEVSQWFLKITDYAEKLLWKNAGPVSSFPPVSARSDSKSDGGQKDDVELRAVGNLSRTATHISDQSQVEDTERSRSVDWPKSLRESQNYWIGKSEGVEIEFQVATDSVIANTSMSLRAKRSNLSVNSVKQSQKGIAASSRSVKMNVTPRNDKIKVFTKFPETIFGVTYMVLAPEHGLVAELLNFKLAAFSKEKQISNIKLKEIKEYLEKAKRKSEFERTSQNKEKTGVFTGIYCTNPLSGKIVPVWVADYVIAGYGTGAVMGVPASDVRDFEFAKKFGLEIIRVIGAAPGDQSPVSSADDVLEQGWVVNSGQFDGLKAPDVAKQKFIEYIEKQGFGQKKTNYHLHDWSISRQRYWGTPIPIIYCPNCFKSDQKISSAREGIDFLEIDGTGYKIIPVPFGDLPVTLPYEVDYAPTGKPPLATADEWVKTKCPICAHDAVREVETMDTFVDSSWYFLRYLDPSNEKEIFDSKIVDKWLPAEVYVGGAEHTLGHTLYSRFFVKFFRDLGLVGFEEYAKRRIHHGIILGADGSKMSKSRGNVVNPDDEVAKYGADSVRTYLAFLGPYDIVASWNPSGIKGVYNFYQRVWKLVESYSSGPVKSFHPASAQPSVLSQLEALRAVGSPFTFATQEEISAESRRMMHKTIKKVGDDIEKIKFNTGVAALMEWLNFLEKKVASGPVTAFPPAPSIDSGQAVLRVYPERSRRAVGSLSSGATRGNSISRQELETFLLLLAPYGPHVAEELWQRVHSSEFIVHSRKTIKSDKPMNYELQAKRTKNWSIHQQPWPAIDDEAILSGSITLVVQVDGKVRGKIEIKRGLTKAEAEKEARGSEKIEKLLEALNVKKVFYVPERLINFVT